MLCTAPPSAEDQAPPVRRARVWVSVGGWVLRSRGIYSSSAQRSKPDSAHSVRTVDPTCIASLSIPRVSAPQARFSLASLASFAPHST